MNTLSEVRTEVTDQLADAGIKAVEYIPARLAPPVVVISAGNPYVENGLNKTFKDVLVRLEFRVVAETATNEKATDSLDGMICDTLLALSNWDMETVSQPFGYEVNNAVYLAADVVMTASITIEGGH